MSLSVEGMANVTEFVLYYETCMSKRHDASTTESPKCYGLGIVGKHGELEALSVGSLISKEQQVSLASQKFRC